MIDLWTELAREAGLSLSPAQIGQLDRYLDLLIERNAHINLTRITDKAEAEIKHVADALAVLRYLPPSAPHASRLQLADVGTGGGIPGAILAIARPDIAVTLIDSTKKKLDAVQSICDAVGVSNVRTLHTRIEAASLKFDVVTARAVAELDTLLGWCERLMKPRGVLIALKGPKAREEIDRLSPHARRRWTVTSHAPAVPQLDGHITLVCALKT